MARSATQHREDFETETAADETAQEAWLKATTARKIRAVRDGVPYGYVETVPYAMPAPPWFNLIPESHREAVCAAYTQFLTRIVQPVMRTGGNSIQGAVDEFMLNGTVNGKPPRANESNAFESVFYNKVAAAVERKSGALPKSASDAAKRERAKTIEGNVANWKKNKPEAYDDVIGKAIASAHDMIAASDTKRSPKEEAEIELAAEEVVDEL